MGRLAAEFSREYPEVKPDITLEDRVVDPSAKGYDVVIRGNPSADSTLVGRCFIRDQQVIVAARSLAPPTTGTRSPKETVPLVMKSGARDVDSWPTPDCAGRDIAVRKILELPTYPMVRDASPTGIGAGMLPKVLVEEDLASGRLVCWGMVSERPAEMWVLHPSNRFVSAKVQAFARFLLKFFRRRRGAR